MPSTSESPMGVNLSELLERLCASGVEFILVGGLAAVVHGSPATTMDVDIVHKRTPENIARIMKLLESLETVYRRPDDKKIEPKESELEGMGRMLFTKSLGPLDILSFIEERKTYEDLIHHTVEIPFRGHMIRVLDLKVMVDLKRLSSAPEDKQRLAILEETLRQSGRD